jgi:hypothetical protein
MEADLLTKINILAQLFEKERFELLKNALVNFLEQILEM